MKTLTITLLIIIQTASLCFGQTNIERQTKSAKVIKNWKTEKRFSSGNQIILNYELEIEGEEDECGNWVLSVGIIEWDKENPYKKSGVESIEIGFVSKNGNCTYANIYQPQPGKANIVIDGSIITSKNYQSRRTVEIEKLSDGTYRLTEFSRQTYTGKIIQTFKY